MAFQNRWLGIVAFAAGVATVTPAAHAQLVCDEYAGDPAEGTPEWTQRDAENVECGNQKFSDADASPAFHAKYDEQVAIEVIEYATVTQPEWAAEPNRLHNPGTTVPASKVTDPFRSPEEWAAAGHGRHWKGYFINNATRAKLRARVFAPNLTDPPQTYPVLAFSPGLQSYNEVNEWFPEEMAEAGYVVMIVDPQGQGDSELCGHEADGTPTFDCPSSQTIVYQDGLRSAIDFLLSTPANPYPFSLEPNGAGTPAFNPFWESVDPEHVGISGHSYGAIASTPLGQQDPRVDAIVSYDNLDADLGASVPRRTPTLFTATDYPFPATPFPMGSNPDADQHLATAYEQLIAAGVDTMSITSRASDHYEWGYQPLPANFPSSRYGERVALYFTLAWFDRYLKGDPDGTARLMRGFFDETSDLHSIGAGTYDPALAAASPTDPFAGNVPYQISGKCVANLLSFYYHSAYWLEGGALQTGDMRALGCDDLDVDGILDAADNCPNLANEDQLDRGGVNSTEPDGIGDACQCGDVSGNGIVNGQDANAIKRHGLGVTPNPLFNVPGNCDVSGNGICNGQDANAVTRAALGQSSPSFGQNCHNATGQPVPPNL
jgi:predicted dienelactone hydrolase